MQVNQLSDHVTHAVIGNKVAREAQISGSAEFFNVLSNTLYSDKQLAVIREVLCNAWDIHIQQGITDRAVEITLTDNKLTIRDFGTGIHDDHIVDVYLTYGNSTKKLDGTQTGGFGLGSKAPWAYVDHFEVISFHQGRKTVYAMSKSSGEVGGKPSALPILSVPTTETGLSVSMAIASRDDSRKFGQIIRTIAEFGEMNVVMNGDALNTVAFSQAKHGFLFIKKSRMQYVSGGSNSRVFIRYGNVIYPLPSHEKLNALIADATRAAGRISGQDRYGNSDYFNLILQAKPDTISVTPSRESLSMTDHTIKHAEALLLDFLALFNRDLETACIDTTKQGIAHTWSAGRPADLLTSNNEIPGLLVSDVYGNYSAAPTPEIITDVPTASRAYLSRSYPDFRDFQYRDTIMRLKALETSGFGNRGKIQSFRREYEAEHRGATSRSTYSKRTGNRYSDWFKRVMVLPLMRAMDADPNMNSDKLMVRGRHKPKPRGGQSWTNEQAEAIVKALELSPRQLEGYMPFLRNFVVLSFNRLDIEERLDRFPIMRHWLGKTNEMFCYIVPRTAGKADQARAFFQKQGMTIVDLTIAQSWEPQHVIEPIAKPVIVKPRKKGIPVLGGIVKDGQLKPALIVTMEDFPRIETPEFIVKLNPRAENARNNVHSLLNANEALYAVELYGAKGGVVVNDNQYARFKAMGIPSFDDWLIQRITDEIMTNPGLQSFYSMRTDALEPATQQAFHWTGQELLKVILGEPRLAKQFGLTHAATAEDRKIFSIFNGLKEYRHHLNKHPSLQTAIDHVSAIKADPKLADLVKKLTESKLIKFLHSSHIEELFNKMKISPTPDATRKKQMEGVMDLLLYAIEG